MSPSFESRTGSTKEARPAKVEVVEPTRLASSTLLIALQAPSFIAIPKWSYAKAGRPLPMARRKPVYREVVFPARRGMVTSPDKSLGAPAYCRRVTKHPARCARHYL